MFEQGKVVVKQQVILVSGAGAAGLSAALAFAQAGDGRFTVVVCDPAEAVKTEQERGRAYALSAGPRLMLERLGAWAGLADSAQPMLAMDITDGRPGDAVRLPLLSFEDDARDEGAPFAHMVEGDALIESLRTACEQAGVSFLARGVKTVEAGAQGATVHFTDGGTHEAALVVAADGRNSPIRKALGIGWVGHGYGQAGIVATLGHERPHEGRAVQHFLPAGSFAMLPLTGNRSSIVWTEPEDEARMLVTLDDEDIIREITRRFGHGLGELRLLDRPRAFPLAIGMARSFISRRVALVGDAAHVVHPLAGQGLNVGLRDVAALVEAVLDRARLGFDAGHGDALEHYERARRFDTLTMGVATDGLNRLFSNDILPLRLGRDLGLGLVNRLPPLKRLLAREAAGHVGATPRLLRGEAP